MREEKKQQMEAASEELERRSRYLSSLIQRTRLLRPPDTDADSDAESPGVAMHREEKHRAKQPQREGEEGEKGQKKNGGKQDRERSGGEADDPAKEANVRVRAADMAPALQRRAFRCAREALKTMPKLDSKRLALALKKEFDSSYGPAWHCIVGTSFGSYVTHSLGGFLYFSIDKVHILLFRTAVEPLGH